MKLKKLFWNRNNTIKAFPISHILLVIASIILIWHIEWSFSDHFSFRALLALAFAFLLSCLWPIIQIHSNFKNKNAINRVLQISSIILWWLYYFILTRINNLFDATYSEWLIYFWIILLSFLSIPLVIALLHKKEEPKIRFSWNSLITSIIYWAIAWSVVWWGIAWALWSIEALFDVYIDSDRYLYIWVLSEILFAGSFIFNYYLTLVEKINQNKSEFKIETSRIRRIFWSFIFLPLALIYLIIFGSYWVKILITGVWPNGIIVWLWIWYFVLWILSAYLIYPDKTKTHEIIYKILYVSFILIALMMIWAITQRINQYWITINRRFICYIILFIILHSALSLIFPKKRLLSFILLLSILTLLSLYWPISSKNISYKSQLNKLQEITSKENLSLPLWEKSLSELDWESQAVIMSIVEELAEKYNKDKVIDKIISYDYNNTYRYSTRLNIRDYLWVDNSGYDYYDNTEYYNYRQNAEWSCWIDIAWYSKLYKFQEYNENTRNHLKLNIEDKEYKIDLSNYIEKMKEKSELYKKTGHTNEEEQQLKEPALIIDQDDYRLIISWFHWEQNRGNQSFHFRNIEWYILIK